MVSMGHPELIQEIKKRIHCSENGTISFAEFMELCLYHPKWGYYQIPTQKLGKNGDFYTSSGIGNIMGEVTARYFLQYVQSSYAHTNHFHYIEWGGGDGKWAKDIMDAMARLSPSHYGSMRWTAIEASPFHREIMLETTDEHRDKVTIIEPSEWEAYVTKTRKQAEVQFVLGNELLDAFPVHRIGKKSSELKEIGVGWNENKQQFEDVWRPPMLDVQQEVVNRGIQLKDQQVAEINVGLTSWFQQLYNHMSEGIVLLLDYGDLRDEIYAPHRMNGTLMCYRKHEAHDDPYQSIGQQDITSHVDFTACIDAAELAGFKHIEFTSQKKWLLDHHLLDMLQNHTEVDPFAPVARRNRAIRQLLVGDGMSEVFKVLTMKK